MPSDWKLLSIISGRPGNEGKGVHMSKFRMALSAATVYNMFGLFLLTQFYCIAFPILSYNSLRGVGNDLIGRKVKSV